MDDETLAIMCEVSCNLAREQNDQLIRFILDKMGSKDDLDIRRRLLFELHDSDIISKAQVRRYANLDPGDYWDELIAWRQGRRDRQSP